MQPKGHERVHNNGSDNAIHKSNGNVIVKESHHNGEGATRKRNLVVTNNTGYTLARTLRDQKKDVSQLIADREHAKAANRTEMEKPNLRFSLFYRKNSSKRVVKGSKEKSLPLLYKSIFEPLPTCSKHIDTDVEISNGSPHFKLPENGFSTDQSTASEMGTTQQTMHNSQGNSTNQDQDIQCLNLAKLLRTQKSEIQLLRKMPIEQVNKIRMDAERYLVREAGIDAVSSTEYFQGPRSFTLSSDSEANLNGSFNNQPAEANSLQCAAKRKLSGHTGAPLTNGGNIPSEQEKLEYMQRREFQSDLESIRQKLDRFEAKQQNNGNRSTKDASGKQMSSKKKRGAETFGKTEFRESEALLQYAFIVRAENFGLNNTRTVYARQNLYRCYLAQLKKKEAEELNEHPADHLQRLKQSGVRSLALKFRKIKLMKHSANAANKRGKALNTRSTVVSRPGNSLVPIILVQHGGESGVWTSDLKFVMNGTVKDLNLERGSEVPLEYLESVEIRQGRTGNKVPASGEKSEIEKYNQLIESSSVQKPIHYQVRDLLLADDFWTAGEVARVGLKVDMSDKILEAFFNIARLKTSCYPRWADFRATVELEKLGDPQTHILGEKLNIRYDYEHDSGPARLHTLQDTIGLFRILDASKDDSIETNQDLVQWVTVPATNQGTVEFVGVPNRPGNYLARYLVHGSTCPVGSIVRFRAEHTETIFTCPRQVNCGQDILIDYKIKVNSFEHSPNDYVGIFAIEPQRVRAVLKTCESEMTESGFVVESLSGFTQSQSMNSGTPSYTLFHTEGKCLATTKFPKGNEGIVRFSGVPKLPGLVEFRAFDSQFGNTLIGTSHPVSSKTLKTWKVQPRQQFLRREIRVFIGSTLRDFNPERLEIMRVVLPRLQAIAQSRRVSLTLVDLASSLNTSDLVDGIAIATYLREIDACRPFSVFLLGERYGWVPSKSVMKSLGQEQGFHAWMDEYANPVLLEMMSSGEDDSDGRIPLNEQDIDDTIRMQSHENQLKFSMLEMGITYSYLIPKAEFTLPETLANGSVRGAGGNIYTRNQTTRVRGAKGRHQNVKNNNANTDTKTEEEDSKLLFTWQGHNNVAFQEKPNTLFYERHPILTVRNDELITEHELSARDADLAMRNMKSRIIDTNAFVRQNLMSATDIAEYMVNDISQQIEELFPVAQTPIGSECEAHMLCFRIESWCDVMVQDTVESPFVKEALMLYLTPKVANLPWRQVSRGFGLSTSRRALPRSDSQSSVKSVSSRNKKSRRGSGTTPRGGQQKGTPKRKGSKELKQSLSRSQLKLERSGSRRDMTHSNSKRDLMKQTQQKSQRSVESKPSTMQAEWDGIDKYVTHPDSWKGTPLVIAGPPGSCCDAQLVHWLRTVKTKYKKWEFRCSVGSTNTTDSKLGLSEPKQEQACAMKSNLKTVLELRHEQSHAGCYFRQPENSKARASLTVSVFGCIARGRKTLFVLVPIGQVSGLRYESDVVRHIVTEACCAFSLSYPIPSNQDRLVQEFCDGTFLKFLEDVSGSLFVVIIGLDLLQLKLRVDESNVGDQRPLSWYPSDVDPKLLRMVCSCDHESVEYDVALALNWNVVLKGSFDKSEIMVDEVLQQVCRSRPGMEVDVDSLTEYLYSNVTSEVPAKGSKQSTEIVSLLLPWQVTMVVDDWQVKQSECWKQHINSTEVVKEFLPIKPTLVETYIGMIQTVEIISKRLVQDVLCLIRCSPMGLQEFELMKILGIYAKAAAAVGEAISRERDAAESRKGAKKLVTTSGGVGNESSLPKQKQESSNNSATSVRSPASNEHRPESNDKPRPRSTKNIELTEKSKGVSKGSSSPVENSSNVVDTIDNEATTTDTVVVSSEKSAESDSEGDSDVETQSINQEENVVDSSKKRDQEEEGNVAEINNTSTMRPKAQASFRVKEQSVKSRGIPKSSGEHVSLLWSQVFLSLRTHLLRCVNGSYEIAHPSLAKAIDERYGLKWVTKHYDISTSDKVRRASEDENGGRFFQQQREQQFFVTQKYMKRIIRYFGITGLRLYTSSSEYFTHGASTNSSMIKIGFGGSTGGSEMHTARWFRRTDILPQMLQQSILLGPKDHRKNLGIEQMVECITEVDNFALLMETGSRHKFFEYCSWLGLPQQEILTRLRGGFEQYFNIYGFKNLGSGFVRYDQTCYRHFLSPAERGDPDFGSSSTTAVSLDDNQLLKQIEDHAKTLLFQRLKLFRARGPLVLCNISLFCTEVGQLREAMLFAESALFVCLQARSWEGVWQALQGGAQQLPVCFIPTTLQTLLVFVEILTFRILDGINYGPLGVSSEEKGKRTSPEWLREKLVTVFGVVPNGAQGPSAEDSSSIQLDDQVTGVVIGPLLDKRGRELLNKLECAYKVYEALRVRVSPQFRSIVALRNSFEVVNEEIKKLNTIHNKKTRG